jgi:hypothetical protein
MGAAGFSFEYALAMTVLVYAPGTQDGDAEIEIWGSAPDALLTWDS